MKAAEAEAAAEGDDEEEEEEGDEEGEGEGEGEEEAAEEAAEEETGDEEVEEEWQPTERIRHETIEDRYFLRNETLRGKFNTIEIDSFMKLMNIKPTFSWEDQTAYHHKLGTHVYEDDA